MNRTSNCSAIVMVVALGLLGACGGGGGTGNISGRIGAASPFGQQQEGLLAQQGQALTGALETGGGALSLEGLSVQLLRAEEGADPGAWAVVDSVEPNADGSFSFSEVAAGRYALKLTQPEFGGSGYAVDCTEFDLGDGDSVKLILPMLSNIDVSGPLSGYGVALGQSTLDSKGGRILGLGPGFYVLDYLGGKLDVLFSRKLFSGLASEQNMAVLALAPDGQQAFVVMENRILRVDLGIFKDPAANEVLDYDSPEDRLALGDAVAWRWILKDRRIDWGVQQRDAFFSPDGATLYVSGRWTYGQSQWGPMGGGSTQVIDTATLELKRVIQGTVVAYNAAADRLIFANGSSLLLVDATLIRDVGSATFAGPVMSATPIPGGQETLVVYQQLSSGDQMVPFLARVSQDGQVLEDLRASQFLGLGFDPQPGFAAFDETGRYFTLGTMPFEVLQDGSFVPLDVPVQPGQAFLQRVSCNPYKVFDPKNRYELWYGCDQTPGMGVGGTSAIALLSADQGSIPVSVRPGQGANKNLLLDAARGLAIFHWGNGYSLVHYADPEAADRPSQTHFADLGQALLPPPIVCSESQACPDTQLCLPDSDTAWTGKCVDNPRIPFVPYCGGMTRLACDHGFTCKQDNPSNPNSPGLCEGQFSYDFDQHGFPCSEAQACPEGFECSPQGHCLPQGCLTDADCKEGQVCGLVLGVGRACVTSGPLADGELCFAPEQCLGGACVTAGEDFVSTRIGLEAPWPIMQCSTPCFQNADCPDGGACYSVPANYFGQASLGTVNGIIFPVCLGPGHAYWVETCEEDCQAHELCAVGFDPGVATIKAHCQVGFVPSDRDFGACDSPWDCPTPAVCGSYGLASCRLPCTKTSDCPFPVECLQGGCGAAVDPNDPEAGPQQYLCEEGQGCAADQFCGMVDFHPLTGLVCLEGLPCQNDQNCAQNQTCQGICTTGCEGGADCPAGWQCVFGPTSGGRRHCLPGVCACPDPSPFNANCDFVSGLCSVNTVCAPAPCDGTYGPDNCCDADNPCELSDQGVCRCPASCSWWRPEGCSPSHENPPAQGGVPLCPSGYSCKLVQDRLFGHRCEQQ